MIKDNQINCPKPPNSFPKEDRNCICNKPLYISIPQGKHIHCPVHPSYIIRGSQYSL